MSGVNPLLRWTTQDAMVQYASDFHQSKNLSQTIELKDFLKGVLYFKDPGAVSRTQVNPSAYTTALPTGRDGNLISARVHIDDLKLTDIDIDCIKRYKEPGRMKQWRTLPRSLRLIQAACAIAAVTQGWDQSSMNAANLGWTGAQQLNLTIDDLLKNPSTRNAYLFGLVNGAPFFLGSIVGFIFTDPLSNKKIFGRRLVLFIAGVFSLASVLGSAGVKTWKQLLVCRLLLGAGMGTKACIVPILLSEVAPTKIRSMMVTTWQMFVSLGILLGFVANLACYRLDHTHYWKWMFAAAGLPALLMFFLIPFCPESPRWLLRQGRIDDALKSLIEIHPFRSNIIAGGDLLSIYEALHSETKWLFEQAGIAEMRPETLGHRKNGIDGRPERIELPSRATLSDAASDSSRVSGVHVLEPVKISLRWKIMFRSQRMRSANYASATVMISQQLCGINLLAFLSSTFYSVVKQGTSATPPPAIVIGLGAGFGLVNFLFSFVAFLCVDFESPQARADEENYRNHWLPQQITRRTLLNVSFPLMAIFLLMAGLALLAPPSTSVAGAHYAMLYLFTAAYSIGEGPMAFLISAEVYPLVNREIGMSLAVFWNFIGAGIISLVAPALARATHHWGLFVLFSGLNVCCWVACYFIVPQTQGSSIDVIFGYQDQSFKNFIAQRWNKLLKQLYIGGYHDE